MKRISWIDSHFHLLEMEKKKIDIELTLNNLMNKGFVYGLDISVDMDGLDRRAGLAEKHDFLYFTTGLTPASTGNPGINNDLMKMAEIINHPKCLAVGEIGLDYHWNYGTPALQQELFIAQLALAAKKKVPVIIHTRDADADTIGILASRKPDRAGIIHCFSSDYAFARQAIDLGFCISFAGNVTFPKAVDLQETAKKIPLESLLIETDAPYLSPVPVRGKPNTPEHIIHTYNYLAELRGLSLEDLASAVLANFKRIMGL
ncbi:MAG: TatD family hydrolase [Spirochaetales bacterium]|nr:TatD family hydrolase [Spirochaetales bacterium]